MYPSEARFLKSKHSSLAQLLTGYVAQFGVLANFVGGSGANWGAINVNNGFLPHVKPNDWAILGPFVAAGLFNGLFKAFLGGLAAAVDLVARDPWIKNGWNLVP